MKSFIYCLVNLALLVTNVTCKDPKDTHDSFTHARLLMMSNSTNSLLTLHSQLAAMSRVANAIYLQKAFIDNPSDADGIFAELVNLPSVQSLKDIEKINAEAIDSLSRTLESFPRLSQDLYEDVNLGMVALDELKKADSKVAAIDGQKVDQFFGSLEGCVAFLETEGVMNRNSAQLKKTGDALARFRNTTEKTQSDWKKIVQELRTSLKKSEKSYNIISSWKPDICSEAFGSLASISPLVQRSKLSDLLVHKIGLIYRMGSSMATVANFSTILANYIDDLAETFPKSMEDLEMLATNLSASTTRISRLFTPAYSFGAIDFAEVTQDLETTWVREKMSGRKLELALFPVKRLGGRVWNIWNLLYATSRRTVIGEALGAIREILSKKAEVEILRDVESSVGSLNALLATMKTLSIDSFGIDSLHSKISNSEVVVTAMVGNFTQMTSSEGWESMGAHDHLRKLLAKPDDGNVTSLVARINADKTFSQIPVDFGLVHLEPFLKQVKVLRELGLSVKDGKAARNWVETEFPKLLEFLDGIKKQDRPMKVFTIGIAFAGTIDLSRFSGPLQDTSDDLKTTFRHLTSCRNDVSELPAIAKRNRVVNAVGQFADGRKVSEVLGKASELMKDIGFALAKSKHLKTVAQNSEAIGKAILNLQDPKMKSEIQKGWNDSEKIKEALEALLADVTRLGQEIPATGASDVAAVGSLLDKLNNVKDPEINVEDLQSAVDLLSSQVFSPEIAQTNLALLHLLGVDLNFASRSAALKDVSTSVVSFEKIVEELDKEATAVAAALAAAAAQKSDLEAQGFSYTQYALLALILIVTLIMPAFVIFANITEKNRQKYGAPALMKKLKGMRGKKRKEGKQEEGGKKEKKGKKEALASTAGTTGANATIGNADKTGTTGPPNGIVGKNKPARSA